ncbi:MAG: hypothetical protein CMK59_04370 [Proteobacteria bacterium]|nr:hypothetical protein [Pseudomonadota bacterium]
MIAILLLGACGDKEDTGISVEPMSFVEMEQDVLGMSCAFSSCHGAGAGGLTLAGEGDYERLVDVASTQLEGAILVVPGDSENSYLMTKLRGTSEIGDSMPPGALLDDVVLAQIAAWIDAGALP